MAFTKTAVKLDTREFKKALEALVSEFPKKDMPAFLNKRMFYVVRKAIWFTHTADYYKIAKDMGQIWRMEKDPKRRGRPTMVRGRWRGNTPSGAPLASIIINARRGRKGQPGLYGADMEDYRHRMVAARFRSIGFIKAGWISARDTLSDAAGLPRVASTLGSRANKRAGVAAKLGGAIPAGGFIGFFKWRVAVWNQANAKRDHAQAIITYGRPAIQRALDEEAQEMRGHLAKKLEQRARAAQIRVQNSIAASGES